MQYANGDLEEALSSPVPTQQPHYGGQMSVEEIDGGANSGSYAAGQQQRRIIREIIVWTKDYFNVVQSFYRRHLVKSV